MVGLRRQGELTALLDGVAHSARRAGKGLREAVDAVVRATAKRDRGQKAASAVVFDQRGDKVVAHPVLGVGGIHTRNQMNA